MLRKPPVSSILQAFCWTLLLSLFVNASVKADDQAIAIDWSSLASRHHQVDVQNANGEITFVSQGNDPFVWFRLPPLEHRDMDWVFEWEYFCPDGITTPEWRMGDNASLSPVWELPSVPKAEGWTTYSVNLSGLLRDRFPYGQSVSVRMDLGTKAKSRLSLRRTIIRPISAQELEAQQHERQRRLDKQTLAETIREHHQQEWPVVISQVKREGASVVVRGVCPRQRANTDHWLVLRSPEDVAATPVALESRPAWPIEADALNDQFQVTLDGEAASALRPGSRFQVCRRESESPSLLPCSAEVYPTVESEVSIDPPPALHAAKGLTCIDSRFDPDMLRDLGLQHASVNLLLDGLVSQTEKPGWVSRELKGARWWVNEPQLVGYDRNIQIARDAGCVVAGILLIQTHGNVADPANPWLGHPESSTAGAYAMPNLTTADAVARYAAVLEVLGERYCGTDSRRRIDHWIVHNEVDYGWQWTNMGEQPFEVFMDHYVRSMRLVDGAMRRHNPHATVLISLTHRWNATDCIPWKTYAPREMMRWVIRDSEQHGDYGWGVAYHPYPQSLWEADFWDDTRLNQTDETELITMKNLHVLDRLMHQPETRAADGSVRPVICSEQGYHAAEDQPAQLQTQSVALLKTWQILRECPSVIAFDYHRPVDHPHEGGLRLGLRGLPQPGNRIGNPKPAWEVFHAINTEREAHFVNDLLKQ
ncbi:DUF5722 domain-containing protein [Rhodopirellula sp. MGV]|uniref:DUF5722 domain-containing protein n=1 Tax=Rhodopirellula sp. MGV TaxID=2023130 RepID=UPI000B968717|nr:DUF5722 domain-containing protein [Rhodopirellula sp. MGV]OYP28369.1 hypothetical protein CGZ80_26505 [Rhodopirellula sp. MGV]PNY38755.1 hypothetical protein C2E31_02285 [Rhodopirellula baltica]